MQFGEGIERGGDAVQFGVKFRLDAAGTVGEVDHRVGGAHGVAEHVRGGFGRRGGYRNHRGGRRHRHRTITHGLQFGFQAGDGDVQTADFRFVIANASVHIRNAHPFARFVFAVEDGEPRFQQVHFVQHRRQRFGVRVDDTVRFGVGGRSVRFHDDGRGRDGDVASPAVAAARVVAVAQVVFVAVLHLAHLRP